MSNIHKSFQLYNAAALVGVVARDVQKKLGAADLAAEAATIAYAACAEEVNRFPNTGNGTAVTVAPSAPSATRAPQPGNAPPLPVGVYAPLPTGAAPPSPGTPQIGVPLPTAPVPVGIPVGAGGPGTPVLAPNPFGPPIDRSAGPPGASTGPVEKVPVPGAVNRIPLGPDTLCPACQGLRAGASVTGDVTCTYLHYEPNGRLPVPAGMAGAPTMTTGPIV